MVLPNRALLPPITLSFHSRMIRLCAYNPNSLIHLTFIVSELGDFVEYDKPDLLQKVSMMFLFFFFLFL